MGKGDKNRVSNMNAYWSSPLWDNIGNKATILEAQSEAYKPKRFLFLDDIRIPQNAWIHDENKTLQQVSGIDNFRWDIVRTYEQFVEYVETFGIPHVVSFDNDLVDVEDPTIMTEELIAQYSMINWKDSKYKTGAHCADWLCERCKAHQHPLPKYYVHSANKVARPIIRGIMEASRPLIKH